MIKGLASSLHRDIHVRGVGFRHLADLFTGGWINGGERFAGLAVHPPIVDKKFGRRHGGF